MSKILALDTSSEACSVALWLDGEVLEDFRHVPRKHTQLLLPMVDQLLVEAGVSLAQLDALAFGRGPGSFTGLRIATGAAQGLALGADLPMLPVSTLAALAQFAHREGGHERVFAVLDARMDEVYWGLYCWQSGCPILQGAEHVSRPESIVLDEAAQQQSWVGVGSGWNYLERFGEPLRQRLTAVDPAPCPRAQDIARLAAVDFAAGLAVPPEQALPVYLRDNVAKKKSQQGR